MYIYNYFGWLCFMAYLPLQIIQCKTLFIRILNINDWYMNSL